MDPDLELILSDDWLSDLLCTMKVTLTSISPRYFSSFFPGFDLREYHLETQTK